MAENALPRLKAELMARTGRGARLGLARMERALDRLGRPDRELAAAHVGGTNGKGSTCAFLEAMARAAGAHTGFYSSPHLCRLNERIRLDGVPLDDDRLAAVLGAALALDPELTFFEVMTLAALIAMSEARVTLAILEVGLGGRLDATNVVERPRCTAITSIALDHCAILGSSLTDIAREKAGILKRGAPLVLGPMPPEPREAILERAAELEVRVVEVAAMDGDRVAGLALAGGHQGNNAAVARAMAHELGLDPRAVAEGLRAASWPGRLERIPRGEVTVLLDCAHNPHAVEALAAATADLDPARTHLVFGTMGDKAWPEMLARLGPRATRRYYCEPLPELAGRRATPPPELAALFPGTALGTPVQALERALAGAAPGDCILVTGSIFLVGAARGHLLGIEPDIMVPL